MDIESFERDIEKLALNGTRAVTVTGGGEPLMHRHLDKMVKKMHQLGIAMGLVTNGSLASKWTPGIFSLFSWIRVSYDMMRNGIPDISNLPSHAFSYVWSPGAELTRDFKDLTERPSQGRLTHLRVVSDITRADDDEYSTLFHIALADLISNPKQGVFVQPRDVYRRGAKKCWVSLLKPALDVDGQVYPCCGSQYAINLDNRRPPKSMAMGNVEEYLENHVNKQIPFDGSVCKVCYYGGHNDFIEAFLSKDILLYPEFI